MTVKLRANSGAVAGKTLRGHTFSVETEAINVASVAISSGINFQCLRNFSIVFIGDGDTFSALRNAGFSAATVDPERTLEVLTYLKEAEHPLYKKLTLPSLEEASAVLEDISRRASAGRLLSSITGRLSRIKDC